MVSQMPGITLNEDNSHFYSSRAGQHLDQELVDVWVDQYADTQVRELMLCPNSMRTSYASEVWDPIWAGYEPDGPDDQPLLASTPPENRAGARRWIHTAWQLHQNGIDVYERWIQRCRQHGISPWVSMRMNDIHNVDDEERYIHSEFWRKNPQFRRVPYRFTEWTDHAFDYGRQQVRDHHMSLIQELVARYDMDGLELDWMRFGYHLRPGYESQGVPILNEFTAQVRRLLDTWEAKRGHRIKLGARVPSRSRTALGLGMDAVTWAREGWVDMLVITPFWASIETDMPVEIWKQLLEGTGVILATGLELCLRSYREAPVRVNTLETVRGAAASFLDRGADRVYLFNYMDSDTAIENLGDYPRMLREIGSLDTLQGKVRRHVLTFADTWAPGEPRAVALPAPCAAGEWKAFRIHTGPAPTSGEVLAVLGIKGEGKAAENGQHLHTRVNGVLCPFAGRVELENTNPEAVTYGFAVPLDALYQGYNLIEVVPDRPVTFAWAEISIYPKGQERAR